jgi:hypothetical protein
LVMSTADLRREQAKSLNGMPNGLERGLARDIVFA